MKRLLPLVLFLTAYTAKGAKDVQIYVGPGKDLTVTIPNIDKQNLRDILAIFFGKEHPASVEALRKAFAESGDVTIVLTSK